MNAITTGMPNAAEKMNENFIELKNLIDGIDISEINGNAATATKLKNARSFNVSGDVSGTTQSFDGSADVTIPTTLRSVERTNTTTTANPSFGGTFTVIDSLTTDSKGRVTGVRTKTVTVPDTNPTTVSKNFTLNGQQGYIVQSKLLNWVTLYIYWANGNSSYNTTNGTSLFAVDSQFVGNSSRVFTATSANAGGTTVPLQISAGEQGIKSANTMTIPPNFVMATQVSYTA